jgi:CRP-like cAMP-binding protein
MLLVMHADTYNVVLRQHHYRQKQLSSATALLQELPLFQHQNYSKLASIAYTMKSQTYSNQTLIVGCGEPIKHVLLVASGQVKVYAPPPADGGGPNAKLLQKRIPKLAIALLGRGQIIGELEVQRDIATFQMTYESGAAGTEVLEMPLTVFKESVTTGGLTQSMMYRNIEEMNDAKEQRRVGRMSRAYEAMKGMMAGESGAIRSKDQLVRALPVLVEPPTMSPSSGSHKRAVSEQPTGPTRQAAGTYFGDERPTVTRKQSFASPRPVDGTGYALGGAAVASPGATGASPGGRGALKFAVPARKASVADGSPRRAEMTGGATRAQSVVLTKSPFSGAAAGGRTGATAGTPAAGIASPPGPKPSALSFGSPRLSVVKNMPPV